LFRDFGCRNPETTTLTPNPSPGRERGEGNLTPILS